MDVMNINGENSFFLACSNGHHDIVKILLLQNDPIDINFNGVNNEGNHAFYCACSNGCTLVVVGGGPDTQY